MQVGTVGKVAIGAAGIAAFAGGAFAAGRVIGDRDPWTLDYGGPGSIEQVPSMLFPWCLPATGAGFGAMVLAERGHGAAALAVGLGAAALYGAGFNTWITGRSRD